MDDELSGSAGTKSRGLADIDYRFSDLARWGTLVPIRRNHLLVGFADILSIARRSGRSTHRRISG
jgi:hypothetical protein